MTSERLATTALEDKGHEGNSLLRFCRHPPLLFFNQSTSLGVLIGECLELEEGADEGGGAGEGEEAGGGGGAAEGEGVGGWEEE